MGIIEQCSGGRAHPADEHVLASGIEVLAQVSSEKPERLPPAVTPTSVTQKLPEGVLCDEDVVEGLFAGSGRTLRRLPGDASRKRLGN